mmetsp:Transcript_6509/g.7960  ORF Transcript_6509/g.7960 Transcript_6509/m.7960 type:complete len:312 (+) Transcript_6509:3-938(+)
MILTAGSVVLNSITGAYSDELNQMIAGLGQSLVLMYEDPFLKALPTITRDIILPTINKAFYTTACKPPVLSTDIVFVDFRDLFMNPLDSIKAGGTGDEPYGDIIYTMVNLLDDVLLTPDANGNIGINNAIASITKKELGIEGKIILKDFGPPNTKNPISSLEFPSSAKSKVHITKIVLENLDSFSTPMELFNARGPNNNIFFNEINFGTRTKPLRVTIQATWDDDGSSGNGKSEIGLSFDFENVMLSAGLFALMEVRAFLTFHCTHCHIPHAGFQPFHPQNLMKTEFGLMIGSSVRLYMILIYLSVPLILI